MLVSKLCAVEKLSQQQCEAMYHLLTRHFENVIREVFLQDLYCKNWVLLIEERESDALKAFSTLQFQLFTFAGEQNCVVYSGDTISDPSVWSNTLLPRAWIAAVNTLHRNYAHLKLYWLLISSGFRTYRFLPTFWNEFYPRYDLPTPAHAQDLLHYLGDLYYKDNYQPVTGLVRFVQPQVLRGDLITVPEERQTNPHIQFFLDQNPGYSQGDELVCLTEICYKNLTKAGQRMWHSAPPL